ncbi:C40 family peptidase [Terrabacter sp. BE26]|uniref:C40 family peptidase n=1 Tax=Terrabacter sp. BE26 TaxID=2898152 RepID=UPI0035BE56DE
MPTTTPACPRSPRHLRSLALTPLLAAALLLGLGGAPVSGTAGTAGTAAPAGSPPGARTAAPAVAARAAGVALDAEPVSTVPLRVRGLWLTSAQAGKWYRWGGAGPTYFDCSGLVYYVFHARLHRYLPRTANAQRLATVRISKGYMRPGDLVFFMSRGWAYHVGVYAGYGRVWHAPRPGQRVQLSRLWTSAWVAGRVR